MCDSGHMNSPHYILKDFWVLDLFKNVAPENIPFLNCVISFSLCTESFPLAYKISNITQWKNLSYVTPSSSFYPTFLLPFTQNILNSLFIGIISIPSSDPATPPELFVSKPPMTTLLPQLSQLLNSIQQSTAFFSLRPTILWTYMTAPSPGFCFSQSPMLTCPPLSVWIGVPCGTGLNLIFSLSVLSLGVTSAPKTS